MTAPNGATITAPSTFAAKVDAEEWVRAERALMEDPASYVAAQARLEVAKEQARRDEANTLSVYAAQYVANRRLRPGTIREYRRLLDNHILPTFGATPLKKISRDSVRAWRAGLPAKESRGQRGGLSPAALHHGGGRG